MRNPRVLRTFLAVGVIAAIVVPAIPSAYAGKPPPAPTTPPGNIPADCAGALFPDIRTGSPDQLQMVNHHMRDWLRFANKIANTGTGDLRLRSDPPPFTVTTAEFTTAYQQMTTAPAGTATSPPTLICEHQVSQFVYHPEHRHWHMPNLALYEIHRATDSGTGGKWEKAVVTNNQGAVMSVKSSFCLIDVQGLDSNSWSEQKGSHYLFCEDEFQGISPRWSDTYKGELEGQEMDVTGLGNGTYYLVSTSNFTGQYLETNLTNNVAWRSFTLSHDATGNPQLRVITGNNCSEPRLCAGNKGWNR